MRGRFLRLLQKNSIDEKGTEANVRVSFLSLLHVLPEHHLEPERAL